MKSTAFLLDEWHAGAGCIVTPVTLGAAQGNGLGLWCVPCRCYCDMEATGKRVTVAESMKSGQKYADVVKAREALR
jgi:hypothetical protein